MLHPIKQGYHFKKTQGFGKTTYSQTGAYGMFNGEPKIHTGNDYASDLNTPVVRQSDGFVVSVAVEGWEEGGYGKAVRQLCEYQGKLLDIINGHFNSITCKLGEFGKAGETIGLMGTTGNSTGVHTHNGGRWCVLEKGSGQEYRTYLGNTYKILNYDNNTYGYFDLETLFDKKEDVLPVDVRYGQEQSTIRETAWKLRYNESQVIKKLYNSGVPYDYERIKKAFIYGYWSFEEVVSVGNYTTWTTMTKPEMLKRCGRL